MGMLDWMYRDEPLRASDRFRLRGDAGERVAHLVSGKMLDYIEANAGDYWRPPSFELAGPGSIEDLFSSATEADEDDLFGAAAEEQRRARAPLAARLRPRTIDDVVGQDHLVGTGRPLRRLVEQDRLTSAIFWGPPGTGKTTLALAVAGSTARAFEQLSAVTAGVKDVSQNPDSGASGSKNAVATWPVNVPGASARTKSTVVTWSIMISAGLPASGMKSLPLQVYATS